jgi:RimJ/RimL family protein N-acetyltransferase
MLTHATPHWTFRPLHAADLPMLLSWLGRPHAAEWWQPTPTLAELEADYGPRIDGSDSTRACIALLDGEPAGFIQCYIVMGSGGGWWDDETDPGARGIDQFLADGNRLGQGLGSAMVRVFLQTVFADPAVSTVQTDPSPRNARAIRAYQKAGFVSEREVITPDGPALLMRCTRASLDSVLQRTATR